ncbi:hypothetical protein IMG5_114790 [Ichthyophthirius multifiliis]|uniref:CAAX prenyl protease n=1 Tax=Ichthyophthirius multifiliis TaxID=5932 RepID=G0QU45_ICHMU|nr:hypothetical protein IMG5_114790 [Ichthyophthirius multifiliis]EGR31269.1 hypothetical protein IMG5_114790 [Ichthyophthirius multifiliis]|eukprot:XP_004034755.1 hypothetical protein IMG5_114790 [Ichthyophthirius multifiliis]
MKQFQMAFAYTIVSSIIGQILEIPFSIFYNFILEERYGFNNQTLSLFIKDQIKNNIVGLILTPILLYLYLKIVEVGGQYFYIYVVIFILFFIFLFQWIWPNFIAPLYNKYEELEEGELKLGINKLAEQNDFPLKKLFKVDGSTRSSHSNAYFFGFGKNKRIVLFDTLINQLEKTEIYAVLCHEIGHWKFNHTFKHIGFLMIKIFLFFYLFQFFIYEDYFYKSFGFNQKSIFIGSNLFVGLFIPINQILSVIQMSLSRIYEFQADQYAFQMGYAQQLCDGLIKMFKENSGNLLPHPIYSWYHYSHPPLKERLDYINNLQKKEK